MGVSEFLAGQLRNPSGSFGRVVMSRVFNRSSAAINELTFDCLALEPDDRVVEVGCGPGDLVGRIAPVVRDGSVAGVDFSADMIRVCAKRFASLTASGRVEFKCAGAERLPYSDGGFTKACTVNTVYFWPDLAGPFGELSRVLSPGGIVVVSFGTPEALRKLPTTRHGFTLHEPDHVESELERAGFGGIELVHGSGRRGAFICAVGTKPDMEAP